VERCILEEVFNKSRAYRHFEMLLGYNALLATLAELKNDPGYTKLQPDIEVRPSRSSLVLTAT
jgi:hypothetical protein